MLIYSICGVLRHGVKVHCFERDFSCANNELEDKLTFDLHS